MFVQNQGTINYQIQAQLSRAMSLQYSVNMHAKFDLEDRLVAFATDVILFTGSLPKNYAAERLKEQLTRSSMSSALNYGEAQGAESRRDFKHKLSITLKELKESRVGMKILTRLEYGNTTSRTTLHRECEELIAIFATIIKRTSLDN